MSSLLKTHKAAFGVAFLILIGAFLRCYNLNWGAPFYFHPDERNIASSITQLVFPTQMNPHFFAYGSLPIYIIYFSGMVTNFFSSCHLSITNCKLYNVEFGHAIIISRFYSALFSTLLIPFIFLLGKKMHGPKTGLTAAFLATFSAGFIQFAHFGTFEMWLTFFSVLLFWFCLEELNKKNIHHLFILPAIFAILLAIKVSSIALLPLPLLMILIKKQNSSKKLKEIILFIVTLSIVYAVTNPFVFLTTQEFLSSIRYEGGVVLGTLDVFYTQSFYNTMPIVFQFLNIFPFLLNPLFTIIFIPAFFYLIYKGIKTKNLLFLFLISYFLLLFLPQAFLFAKWTRYMVPTLPFIYLIVAIASIDFLNMLSKSKRVFSIKYFVLSIFILFTIAFGISYFITAFVKPDTRIEAGKFTQAKIQQTRRVLTEPYDLGIIPFNSHLQYINSFNFYNLDPENNALNEELKTKIFQSDYIILPSQRLLKSRLLNPNKFRKGHGIYSLLTKEALGYQKIYETPCDIFCKITYLNSPVFSFEETASVFERPTVFIFKKVAK